MLCGALNVRSIEQGSKDQTTHPRKKASSGQYFPCWPLILVPTTRLELVQLAPLPPQDSVSTNFTTSALRPLFYCVLLRLLMRIAVKQEEKR